MKNNVIVELMGLDNDKLIKLYNEIVSHIKFLENNLIKEESDEKKNG